MTPPTLFFYINYSYFMIIEKCTNHYKMSLIDFGKLVFILDHNSSRYAFSQPAVGKTRFETVLVQTLRERSDIKGSCRGSDKHYTSLVNITTTDVPALPCVTSIT